MDCGRALKKSKEKLSEQEQLNRASNRMFIFTLVLVSIVFAIDYSLVIKLMEIIKIYS